MITATRMQLNHSKARLNTIRRSFNLLRDKRDGLMQEYLRLKAVFEQQRASLAALLRAFYSDFAQVSAQINPKALSVALAASDTELKLKKQIKNSMSVQLPVFTLEGYAFTPPYGFLHTPAALDASLAQLSGAIPALVAYAQTGLSLDAIAAELHDLNRRTNALEYIVIPDLQQTIKYISSKLEENTRADLSRLIKVKNKRW